MQRILFFTLLLATVVAGCNDPSNDDLRVLTDADSGDATATQGDTDSKQPSVAFVTNQIADFWKISEAGCNDAEKDFDVEVQVRMPSVGSVVVCTGLCEGDPICLLQQQQQQQVNRRMHFL